MDRLTNQILHDAAMHDAMKHLAFLVGVAATIVVLHRILYHMGF